MGLCTGNGGKVLLFLVLLNFNFVLNLRQVYLIG